MELDIQKIAEELILQLWADSDILRQRAEGVKLFLQAIVKKGEEINGRAETESSEPGPQAIPAEQSK